MSARKRTMNDPADLPLVLVTVGSSDGEFEATVGNDDEQQ